MAGFRVHFAVSSALGAAYGGAGFLTLGYGWGAAALAGGLTAVGGLLPDLDSDSGVPVREMFGLAAAFAPFLLYRRLAHDGKLSPEEIIVILAALYLLIRYGLAALFKRLTVHRGMYHSIPAMLIAGLAVFLLYGSPSLKLRLYLAGGVMIGFLSHLVLDELYSVDFLGYKVRLNKYAGSALKFFSPSTGATLTAYVLLTLLGYLAYLDWLRMPPAPP